MSDVIVVEEGTPLTIAQKLKAYILQYPYIVASVVLIICLIIVIVMYNPGGMIFKQNSTKGGKSLEVNIDRMIGSIMDKQEQALSVNKGQRQIENMR